MAPYIAEFRKTFPNLYVAMSVVSVLIWWPFWFVAFVAGAAWSGLSTGFQYGKDI